MRSLMAREWPGNVRELRHMADRYVLGLLRPQDGWDDDIAHVPLSLSQQLDMVEKSLIEQALKQHGGRPMLVCADLGIAKKTLYDKVNRHGIVLDEYRP
jgi:two-component system C4-dicarboxylate transport response regulator DctD